MRLLNARVPELEILELALLIVTVPPLGEKFPDPPTDNVPSTLKLDVGCVPGVPAIVRLLKVRVPKFVILQAVVSIVTVPVGAKFSGLFTVSTPSTVKLLEGWVVGSSLIVKLLKLSVPAPAKVQLSVTIVTVEVFGSNVPETVNVLLIEIEVSWLSTLPEIVKFP